MYAVSTGGYRFAWGEEQVHGEMVRCRLITDHIPIGTNGEYRTYRIPRPKLFRVFAKLQPNEEGILNFANQNGLIGVGEGILPIHDEASGTSTAGIGEKYADWCTAISRMKHAVDLWEAIVAKDLTRLRKLIRWRGKGRIVYCPPDGRGEELIASRSPIYNAELLDRVPNLTLLEPAKWLLAKWLNDNIQGAGYAASVSCDLRLSHQPVPRSLLTAMWQQLARSIDPDESRYVLAVRCTVCGIEFTAERMSARYCSPACSQAAYRARKRAKYTFSHGDSPRKQNTEKL